MMIRLGRCFTVGFAATLFCGLPHVQYYARTSLVRKPSLHYATGCPRFNGPTAFQRNFFFQFRQSSLSRRCLFHEILWNNSSVRRWIQYPWTCDLRVVEMIEGTSGFPLGLPVHYCGSIREKAKRGFSFLAYVCTGDVISSRRTRREKFPPISSTRYDSVFFFPCDFITCLIEFNKNLINELYNRHVSFTIPRDELCNWFSLATLIN